MLEAGDQARQEVEELGVIGRRIGEAREEGVQKFGDVVQGGGLEFAGAVEVFVEDGEGLLGGLAGSAELVEAAAPVEFFDGAGLGVVGGEFVLRFLAHRAGSAFAAVGDVCGVQFDAQC